LVYCCGFNVMLRLDIILFIALLGCADCCSNQFGNHQIGRKTTKWNPKKKKKNC
jgi:hypothetical protein